MRQVVSGAAAKGGSTCPITVIRMIRLTGMSRTTGNRFLGLIAGLACLVIILGLGLALGVGHGSPTGVASNNAGPRSRRHYRRYLPRHPVWLRRRHKLPIGPSAAAGVFRNKLLGRNKNKSRLGTFGQAVEPPATDTARSQCASRRSIVSPRYDGRRLILCGRRTARRNRF